MINFVQSHTWTNLIKKIIHVFSFKRIYNRFFLLYLVSKIKTSTKLFQKLFNCHVFPIPIQILFISWICMVTNEKKRQKYHSHKSYKYYCLPCHILYHRVLSRNVWNSREVYQTEIKVVSFAVECCGWVCSKPRIQGNVNREKDTVKESLNYKLKAFDW